MRIIFSRSNSSSGVSPSVQPDRNDLPTNTTTPTPASSASTATPTPTAGQALPGASPAEQSTSVQESRCVLYNDNYLPVAGAIAENGGLFFHPSGEFDFLTPIKSISEHREQLANVFWELQAQYPNIEESIDNQFRITDWT